MSRFLRWEKDSGSTTPSRISLEELRSKATVVELDNDTYSMVIGDKKRDVVVEYFDAKVFIATTHFDF